MAAPIEEALREVLDAALVRLDHALEQTVPGDPLMLDLEVQRRIAALLPRCHRIATPWLVLDEDGHNLARFVLGAPPHRGMIGGIEDSGQPGVQGWAESLLQRWYSSEPAARRAIDASLRADGYLLL